MSWSRGHGPQLEDEAGIPVVVSRAMDEGYTFVGHNVAFDALCLLQWYPDLVPLVWKAYGEGRILCTEIREKLIDNAEGHLGYGTRPNPKTGNLPKVRYNLGDIIKRRFGHEMDKGSDSWRLRYNELRGVPVTDWPEEARRYALDDAEWTWRLYQDQESRRQTVGYTDDVWAAEQGRQARAALGLKLMSAWGIRTDGRTITSLDWTLRKKRQDVATDLHAVGLLRLDGSKDMAAIREAVVRGYGNKHTPAPTTPKGAISTSREVLEASGDPLLSSLADYDGLGKLLGTYVSGLWAGTDLPIHAYYNVLVATGRTSCSRPNMQNPPRAPGVRECFVPRPGNVFVACDYDSQEMRTWAQSCVDLVGYSSLAQAYQQNPDFDPHMDMAVAAGLGNDKDARQAAKIGNFGLPGGMGVEGLQGFAKGYGVDWSYAFAEQVRDAWRARWTEQGPFFQWVDTVVSTTGRIVLPRSGRIRGSCGYCDGANTTFQGPASDASKAALWEVCRRCYTEPNSALYGWRPVIFIHDEIVLEGPEGECHEAGAELAEVMIEAMAKWTPDVPPRATPTAMRRWAKKAEPVYAGGRLVPWDTDTKQ